MSSLLIVNTSPEEDYRALIIGERVHHGSRIDPKPFSTRNESLTHNPTPNTSGTEIRMYKRAVVSRLGIEAF